MSKKNSNSSADHEPFYVNSGRLKTEELLYRRSLTHLQRVADAYQTVTKEKILSFDDFKKIVEDPGKFYLDQKLQSDIGRFEKLKEVFGPHFSLEKFMESSAVLPGGFDRVVTACQRVRDERISYRYFTLSDGDVKLNSDFYTQQIGKSIFCAITSLERKRLEYARKLQESFLSEYGELIKLEAAERGMENKAQSVIDALEFLGSVPFPLKIELTYDANFRTVKKLLINEDYVIHGHRHAFPKKNQPRPQQPETFRVAQVKEMDGAQGVRLFREGDPVPTDPLRQTKSKLLPHLYLYENGKLTPFGEGKAYPENPLVEQLTLEARIEKALTETGLK
jgi:hypothetical protein